MAIKITAQTRIALGIPDYWDEIISQWLQNNYSCQRMNEQLEFAKDMGISTDSFYNRLPEPYWGNPDNCSFVIMNYNPGPCKDSRHNYRFCADADYSMIHEIKKNKYSSFALSFPLYRDLRPTELWFTDSIGREWWQNQKKLWIEDLLSYEESDKLPFAMELCAWHSVKWKGIDNRTFTKHQNLIKEQISFFKNAIIQSDLHFGICFGKRFKNELLDKLVALNELSLHKSASSNHAVYTFDHFEDKYYIINFWDDRNPRNRYPHQAQEIIDIIKTF